MKWYQSILLPFSWIFGLIVMAKNALYDQGILPVTNVTVPVISVGNLTTGGTGKTPFVEYCVDFFLKRKQRVAILSRGYKRQTSGMHIIHGNSSDRGNAGILGDEPYQLARKFPEVTIGVDADRRRVAQYVVDRNLADIIILDDGFQHRALGRNLDIVLVDHSSSLNNTVLLPAGRRREPLRSLSRAHVLAYTRVRNREETVERYDAAMNAKEIKVQFRPSRYRSFFDERKFERYVQTGQTCLAFSGIGNPASFLDSLQSFGLQVIGRLEFPDHHHYSAEDFQSIEKMYRDARPDMIITTEKDFARMQLQVDTMLRSLPMYYLEISTNIIEGEAELHSCFDELLSRKPK